MKYEHLLTRYTFHGLKQNVVAAENYIADRRTDSVLGVAEYCRLVVTINSLSTVTFA